LIEGAEEGGNIGNTADASFLATLYGINTQALRGGAESFLSGFFHPFLSLFWLFSTFFFLSESFNTDGGYAPILGTGGSDVISTRHAVYIIANLKVFFFF